MSRKMMLVTFMVLPFLAALKLDLGKALEIALSENPTVKVADKEIQKKKYARKGSYASLKSRKTKCDGREKRNVIFEAKTKCAQKSRLLPLSSQNTSVVQTPFESCLNDAFLLNFLLKYHLKPIANLAKNRIFT